ncbi:MAG TPA: hypothetical protein GXZ82_04030 [Firmicutes bacterium]|jgi:hypothetical protein|nr:hypothetical protein [Bacillota bacterium]
MLFSPCCRLVAFIIWSDLRLRQRKAARKLVKRVPSQLVSLALIIGQWAFVVPQSVYAAEIVPDGQTQTQVSSGADGIDITTSTIYGQNALNSFKFFDVHNGDIVNLHVPTGAANLLNLVHLRQSHRRQRLLH